MEKEKSVAQGRRFEACSRERLGEPSLVLAEDPTGPTPTIVCVAKTAAETPPNRLSFRPSRDKNPRCRKVPFRSVWRIGD